LGEEEINAKIRKKVNKTLMDPEIRLLVLPTLSKVQRQGITGGIDTSEGLLVLSAINFF
jgi:hypothetical protein